METRNPNGLLRRRAAMTLAVLPHTSARGFSPASWTEPPAIASEHLRSMEETTAMNQTQEHTPLHWMRTTRTSLPSPAIKLHPFSSQTCDRYARAPPGATCSPMDKHALEGEVIFEDHGVCSCTITDSLDFEREVHEQRALAQPPPAAPQLTNRQRGVQFPLDLTIICAFPARTSAFALTQVWFNGTSGVIEYDDLLALAAAVNIYIKPHFAPQQMNPRSLPELLTAFVHTEFRMLQQPSCEEAVLTPMGWIDMYRRRHTSRQQLREALSVKRQQSQSPSPFLPISWQQPTSVMSHSVSPRQPAKPARLPG